MSEADNIDLAAAEAIQMLLDAIRTFGENMPKESTLTDHMLDNPVQEGITLLNKKTKSFPSPIETATTLIIQDMDDQEAFFASSNAAQDALNVMTKKLKIIVLRIFKLKDIKKAICTLHAEDLQTEPPEITALEITDPADPNPPPH